MSLSRNPSQTLAKTAFRGSKNNLSSSKKGSKSSILNVSPPIDPNASPTPPGYISLYITNATLDLFGLKDKLTPESPYRMIPKADLISDMHSRLAISDFTPAKIDILVIMLQFDV